jgi:hypothetical protein
VSSGGRERYVDLLTATPLELRDGPTRPRLRLAEAFSGFPVVFALEEPMAQRILAAYEEMRGAPSAVAVAEARV